MSVKVYQQTLRGHRSSGRAIRYRILRSTEVDELQRKAATLSAGVQHESDEAASLARRQTYLIEGVKRMLVAVTKLPAPKPVKQLDAEGNPKLGDDKKPLPDIEDPLTADALWEPLDVGKLTMPGEWQYDTLFEAQDVSYLKSLFAFNHEATPDDVDHILKKETALSGG